LGSLSLLLGIFPTQGSNPGLPHCRDITLPTKVPVVKAMVYKVVMYGCESWTIKKAEPEELMLSNCGAREDS